MEPIFVFGSNESGIHGAGAAKEARLKHGAVWGASYGHYGNSFAIPTKNERIQSLPTDRIQLYVHGFLAYAKGHPNMAFKVTRIGCGLAGFKDSEIASMFEGAPDNCLFDELWRPYLGPQAKFWGTF